MACSLFRVLRAAISTRPNLLQSSARRKLRLHLESLETRFMFDGSPHGGTGTLFNEHVAVMELIEFASIHHTTSNPVYYVARDGDSNSTTPNLWHDVSNWLKETYNATSNQFDSSPAEHLPTTGDDVEIPKGLNFIYDISPEDFKIPALTGMDPAKTSVKNNLRLHTVGVQGSLIFSPDKDLLMVFETMVVTSTGALTINEDSGHTARLLIAAPDWSSFSLAHPFDTSLDPFEFARGLISHGALNIKGEDVTPFITLPQLTRNDNNIVPVRVTNGTAAALNAPGSFKFTVPTSMAIKGWSVGDRIVVSGTDPSKVNPATGTSSDEEAVITNIVKNADGSSTIFAQVQMAVLQSSDLLAPPTAIKTMGGLQFDHILPKDPSGKEYLNSDGTAAFGVQIANLTRNINIQSEDPYHTMARGHTMFMHNANVNIAGVGFLGLGRSDKRTVVDDVQFYTKEIIDALNQAASLQTPPGPQIPASMIGEFIPGTGLNPRGRYAAHFHRAGINETDGTDPNNPILKAGLPAEVQDSVVVDSPGWGFVSHTSNVNFDNNVAFNIMGASFVTEAGNEMGRFVGNLAIKGIGANTGEGIESRKVKQDFGFQGDGFWFQGPAIQVDNNIAVSQHHDGFVFFTVPLVQNYSWADPKSVDPTHPTILSARQGAKMNTKMLASVYDAALIGLLRGADKLDKSVEPGNIPILSFKNNTAIADSVGMETWFHLLGANFPRNLGSQIVGLKVANTRGTAMFDPYTNLTTVKDTLLIGNPSSPSGVGMNRNSVTANFTYDNVTIRGFELGIAIPVNGLDIVQGGTFQNKRNLEITTANSQTRTVLLNDKFAADGISVTNQLTFLSLPTAAHEAARINVDLRTSYNPKDRDLSKMFNPDIIRMGSVWLNSFALGIHPESGPKQLYYYQQAAEFKPFPAKDEKGNSIDYGGAVKDSFGNVVDFSGIEVPSELLDKTNSQLFSSLGLSIGGTVAPAGAVNGMSTFGINKQDGTPTGSSASPKISGLIGLLSKYQASLDATSARYTQSTDRSETGQSSPQYVFSYRFSKPNETGDGSTNVSVSLKIGNFVPASGYPVQLTTVMVNNITVTIPAPVSPPVKPVPPTLLTGALTTAQKAANAAATDKYNRELAGYNTYWKNYYNTPVKLSLREGWNMVTGDLDGTGNMRTQLIYGDTIAPDLNLTSPDKNQLRRLSTASNPWKPGTWESTPQAMMGVAVGSTDSTPKVTTVTGQFVAVMHPDDLSFGFDLKGEVVDNSFGHKTFGMFIGNLKSYLNPNDASHNLVPYITPPTDGDGNAIPNYAKIANYKTMKDGTNSTEVVQHLQTIFFAIKDNAGNSKTFAITIYLDSTAPRVGGNSNPSGAVNPSSSMIALANQAYIIDLETYQMISWTDPKRK